MVQGEGKNDIRRKWVRRSLRIVFFVFLVFFLTGVSLFFLNQYILPQLASTKWMNQYKFLKKLKEDVVVVNKTEQITISEDQTISRYSNKSAASVVEIISRKKDTINIVSPQDRSEARYGNGIVMTADGLILTHKDAILSEPSEYQIFTENGKSFSARVVAEDPFTRLIFLKIDGVENLPVASFINPEDLKAGEKIVAIGRSGSDFEIMFKSGLVSQYSSDFSLAGPLASSEKLQGVFFADLDLREERDARMVGSAIADFSGNVVGILGVRKIAQDSQYFIVPVGHIEELLNSFLEKGVIKRASLGVYYLPLSREAAFLLKGAEKGALVYSSSLQQGLAVLSGSAAEKAGVKIMDNIISLNGEEVTPQNNLAYLVSKQQPGDVIELGILREGKEIKLKAALQ